MSRRGFVGALNAMAREADRAARAQQREVLRLQRQAERQSSDAVRFARAEYLGSREQRAADLNGELENHAKALGDLLKFSISRRHAIDLTLHKRSVRDSDTIDPALQVPTAPKREQYALEPVGFFAKLVPGWKKRLAEAESRMEERFERDLSIHKFAVEKRQSALAALQREASELNQRVEAAIEAINSRRPEAVSDYFEMVFSDSEWPDGFHDDRQVAYMPESRQLIIDVRLPTIDELISTVAKYRYVKSTDQLAEVARPDKARRSLYENVVAQSVLRLLHEAFSGDGYQCIDVVVVNAFVSTTDPSTGRAVRPYLVSVRVSGDEWKELDLRNVDPSACLKRLKAAVSRSPSELLPIKPIVDISMVDSRFIQERDVLSGLDSRPNLMELSPGEFESLITNLFQKMGLETKLTQASRDGGVDCVAFDLRPILGGKVIIQAKRYKNTVGVSSVRDLFGTMHNEGASKGILVTTSGYGKAAYDFANGKPLELITGSNLLFLLEEHAGIKAKIEIPDDWVDHLSP